MTLHSRRQFLGTSVAAAAALASGAQLQAKTLKTIGVQLYTVRSIINNDPLGVLKQLEAIGYREAECVSANLDKIHAALKQTQIKPVSLHLDTALFTRNQDKLPAALDDAKSKGFEYVVCPYIAPQDRGGVDVIRKLGETLNKAGEFCNKSGLKLCYHNHAFEFEPVPNSKETLLDVLMKTADPKLVNLELDIMWSQVGGVDPVASIQKYGKRVQLMHVKNVSKEIGPQYNEKVPREAFKEVGAGAINIPAVLKAAEKAGVKHYFVEQDQTPGNPVDSLRQSYEYLSKVNY